jgi:hypothetical protein
MTTWVYIKSEPNLWTVGFYSPDSKWHPDSDWPSAAQAAARVHYQKDPDFIDATLRLDLIEMRKRDPKYQVEDIKVTPPIEKGFVFRAQIPRRTSKQ